MKKFSLSTETDALCQLSCSGFLGTVTTVYRRTRPTKHMERAQSTSLWKETASTQSLSCVPLFGTPWTITHQAPPSMGFPRQEHWSGLPCPSPGELPIPAIEPRSPALQADSTFWVTRETPVWRRCSDQQAVHSKPGISHPDRPQSLLWLTCVV